MQDNRLKIVSGWQFALVKTAMAVNIIFLAFKRFRDPFKVVEVIRDLRRRVIKSEYVFPRCIRRGAKFYGNLSMQGWPSRAHNRYIQYSFDQVIREEIPSLHVAIFAITHSCGFQCQHCLEWDRLNKQQNLSIEQVLAVIHNLHRSGVSQIMFSGGEPMTRAKDLAEILKRAPKGIDFWMFTNGYTVTLDKAFMLRKAGLTGMIISIDHFDPEQHDQFRGIKGSHSKALNAIQHAHDAGLIPALSCCATNEFVTDHNVWKYLEMARRSGVGFVQFLEPKAVGRYSGKRVELSREKQEILERIYKEVNFSAKCRDYPLITYIDYVERTLGCVAHGNNLLYVDGEGYAQNCPFCRGRKFSLLQGDISRHLSEMKQASCSQYETLMAIPAKFETADL